MNIRIQITIQKPIEMVFPIASDVTNLPLYDRSIRSVEKDTPGDIEAGTKFCLVASQFGMRVNVVLVYTAYSPGDYRLSYRVLSGPFPVETRYWLQVFNGAIQLTGEREPQGNGLWKAFLPLLSVPARQKFTGELTSLKHYLEMNP